MPTPQQARFAVVDHNRLLSSFTDEVVAIIDHHEDENLHITADPRVIKPVDFCASLEGPSSPTLRDEFVSRSLGIGQ